MTTMRWTRIILPVLIVLVVISTGVLSGCSKKSTSLSVSGPIFSEVDSQILGFAYTEYETLRQTLDPPVAREELIRKLNEMEGVDEAHLGVDGYTIFLTYTDSDYAAVDTFELDEFELGQGQSGSLSDGGYSSSFFVNNEFSGLSPILISCLSPLQSLNLNTASYDAAKTRLTPKSKKVLFLGPDYWEYPQCQPSTDACINYFRDSGWVDEDVAVKLNKKQFDTYIKPEDFFNLKDYGIILFIGHGLGHYDGGFTEDQIWLEFCALDRGDFERNNQLVQWEKDGKLKLYDDRGPNGQPLAFFRTLIRGDLLREMMSPLPSSYVSLQTCWGKCFENIFLGKGASIFLGWNYMVDATYADANMMNMAKNMLQNDWSVLDAYDDSSVIKSYWLRDKYEVHRGLTPAFPITYEEYKDYRWFSTYETCEYKISPDPSKDNISGRFYYPAWVNLNVTGIPSGIYNVDANIIDENGVVKSHQQAKVNDGQMEVVTAPLSGLYSPPGKYKIQIIASYGANFVRGFNQAIFTELDTTIKTGPNNVTVSLDRVVTRFKMWFTTTEDPSATAITSLVAGSVKDVYLWVQFESGETGDFRIVTTDPKGFQSQMGSRNLWQGPGEPKWIAKMSADYLLEGKYTYDALSPIGEKIGTATLTIIK